jgi:hypothetical protein
MTIGLSFPAGKVNPAQAGIQGSRSSTLDACPAGKVNPAQAGIILQSNILLSWSQDRWTTQ